MKGKDVARLKLLLLLLLLLLWGNQPPLLSHFDIAQFQYPYLSFVLSQTSMNVPALKITIVIRMHCVATLKGHMSAVASVDIRVMVETVRVSICLKVLQSMLVVVK